MGWHRLTLIICFITASIPTSLGQQTGQTLDLGALSFSTVPIATPIQSASPDSTANGSFLTVQETGGWISQPDQRLMSALQSQYASISASPVSDQVAQISSIVSDAQSSVQKRGAVLLLPMLYYAAVYTLITVGLLVKTVKLMNSGVYVKTPSALLGLSGNPSVLQATVNGEKVSVTISSASPSGPTATMSTASQSSLPWPCAGGSCRNTNDPISGDPPYTCNEPGKSGDPCAIVYSDMYSYDPSGTSFALGITSLSSLLAPFTTAGYDPYSTIAPTACEMTAATNTCQGQSVCLCSDMYTLPRTTVSAGSTITDCSYTIMPTDYSCPAGTCSLAYNAQSSPYCTCGGGIERTLNVGETCGTTTVPTPVLTSSTMTASPTPATTACIGGNGPLSLSASVMDFYISPYCNGVASTKSNGVTLNVTRLWPGTCALKLNDDQAIIASVSIDTTNEYCASNFNDQVGAIFSTDDCNTAMSVDVNGCDEQTTTTKHGGWTSINCVKMAWWAGAPGQAAPCSEVEICPPNKVCCPATNSGCIGQ